MLAIDLRNPVDIDSGHGATSFGIDFQQNLILRTIVTRIWNQSWSDPERNPGLDLLQAGSLFSRKLTLITEPLFISASMLFAVITRGRDRILPLPLD